MVLRSPDGPTATIRTDPASGFQSLAKDTSLRQHGIVIDLGHTKNKNKNPVAEKAVQELKAEILRQDPSGNPVSPLNLALAVSRLNSCIRGRGLSAYEMWVQHDQFTSSQLRLLDQQLIADQQLLHKQNHPHSQSSKNPKGRLPKNSLVIPGDIVHLYADKDSSRARSRYLVSAVDGEWCIIRKFAGNQFRNVTYRVKRNECYAVPPDNNSFDSVEYRDYSDYNSDDFDSQQDDFVHQPNRFSLPSLPHSDCPSASIPVTPPELSDPAVSPDAHDTVGDSPVQRQIYLNFPPVLYYNPYLNTTLLLLIIQRNLRSYHSAFHDALVTQVRLRNVSTILNCMKEKKGRSDHASPPCSVV